MEQLAAGVRLTKRSHERRIGTGCRQAENGGNRGMANPNTPWCGVSNLLLDRPYHRTVLGERAMTITLMGIGILVGLSLVVLPARAEPSQPASAKSDGGEFAALERPVAFEISPSTGTLKETAQRGQELIWIRKDNPSERRFQVTNISVGFLRSEVGGQVQMTLLSQCHFAWLFNVRGGQIECHHAHPGRRVAPFLELTFFCPMWGQQPAAHPNHS